MRTGKDLLIASKPFAQEVRWKSWWHLWSTLAVLLLAFVLASFSTTWLLILPGSLLTALVLVRLFIIYHDYMHGTILRDSWIARGILYTYGIMALSPPTIWKHSHDDHHKNNSKSFGPAMGSFPVMTTDDYAKAPFGERLNYIVMRHPLTIGFGYLTSFFYALNVLPFVENPVKYYQCGLAIVVHIGLAVALSFVSMQALFFGLLIPMLIAGGLGSYLFYAQHNFPGLKRRSGQQWDYVYAALYSSSFMRMSPVMHWFTGNIGYHHVHHLNSKIPFYRLPEAMAGIKELQSPTESSLHPLDVAHCLRLKLWDPVEEKLLTFSEAKAA